jgi:hypothetical protein
LEAGLHEEVVMAKSKALLLTIGCNNKLGGGHKGYDPSESIGACLPLGDAEALTDCRRQILHLIRFGDIERHGLRIADLARNRQLVDGPDLGGESTQASYMPAAERYRGRFYAQLGPDGPALLRNSPHHVLIVTPLYGLVAPDELIQTSNCDVDDDPRFRQVWTEGDRLTDFLMAYVRLNAINLVLDLTARDSYRFLISWATVRSEVKQVYHCFGAETAGDESLITLGTLARYFLSEAGEEQLMSIPASMQDTPHTPYERVYFQRSPWPPTGAPREVEQHRKYLNAADEVDRMRRCFVRVLAHLTGWNPRREKILVGRLIYQMRGSVLPEVIAECMGEVVDTRNSIEYDVNYRVTDDRLAAVRRDYAQVKDWARRRGVNLPAECLEV